jgi:hypothetical protein
MTLEQLKAIGDSFVDYIISLFDNKTITPDNLEQSTYRLNQCLNCPVREGNKCSKNIKESAVTNFDYYGEARYKDVKYRGCGCGLVFKIASKEAKCPLGKWELSK